MKILAHNCTSKTALFLGLGLCTVAAPAFSQMAGVSHPEQVPISASPESVAQPTVYEEYKPEAKPSAAITTLPAAQTYTAQVPPVSQAETYYAPYNPGGNAPTQVARGVIPVRLGDPDAGIVTTLEGAPNELPIGTVVKVNLQRDLSTVTTASGSSFTGAIIEAVKRDGRVLLPAGSILSGKITDVHGGKRISGAASIHLEAVSVVLPDGTKYSIRGQVIDTDDHHDTKVDDEGSLIRKGHPKQTAAIFALTTGSGIAAGAVAAGPVGALVGGGIGAGVSTVVWLKQDRQESIPAGTVLVFALSRSLTVGAE